MSAKGEAGDLAGGAPPPQIGAYYDAIFDARPEESEYFPFNATYGLEAKVAPDVVQVADPDAPHYMFAMYRVAWRAESILALSARNIVDGQRHPLIYPAHLLGRSLLWLEQTGPVDAVQGYWAAPPAKSDNYRIYAATLRQLTHGRPASPEQRAIAARATWTGKQLARFGYSAVQEVVQNPYGNIQAFFTRPSSPRRAR